MNSAQVTVLLYAAVGVMLLGLEVVGRLRPEKYSAVGRVLTWAMRRRSTQLGVLLVWWWLGWHFVTNR